MKRFFRMVVYGIILSLLTGCSGNSKYEVDMERLKNTSGEYQFHDLAWDSDISRVENLLGCGLQSVGTVEGREEFRAEEAFEWADVEGEFTCEFAQGKLDTVSILFKPEEEEEVWKSICDELFAVYGAVEADVRTSTSEELQITTDSETYLWEAANERHTAMTISKLSVNGEFKYISLSLYVIPEEKE
ncbi:MAG: hypothetical protein IJZ82_12945 [Lachnospiraceae bacterium]|nr:hypothetical protein [Lachnospiraceae bacterium]